MHAHSGLIDQPNPCCSSAMAPTEIFPIAPSMMAVLGEGEDVNLDLGRLGGFDEPDILVFQPGLPFQGLVSRYDLHQFLS